MSFDLAVLTFAGLASPQWRKLLYLIADIYETEAVVRKPREALEDIVTD